MKDLDPFTLGACRRGDLPAFTRLVRCYQDRVYALCVALAGSDGEDLAQETFARVFGAIGRFDPSGTATLGTWVLTIARRLCQDRAKSARVRSETLPAVMPERLAEGGSPEERLAAARMNQRVGRAVAALPEDQRIALVLREWDGLEYEEIAEVEQIPIGTVRSRLARARETLRETLREEIADARPTAARR